MRLVVEDLVFRAVYAALAGCAAAIATIAA